MPPAATSRLKNELGGGRPPKFFSIHAAASRLEKQVKTIENHNKNNKKTCRLRMPQADSCGNLRAEKMNLGGGRPPQVRFHTCGSLQA